MSEVKLSSDVELMKQAIGLAMLGRGGVEPNPMVGCVIARDGRILGQGYHQKFGGPHAEVNALNACRDQAAGATAYVTLEPCCHLEKKTPPCVPKMINAKLARVVVGCLDPNPMVGGKGIEQLRAAGILTEEGILGVECRQLNAAFFKRMDRRQPYVTVKWAQTANGKVAGAGGKRVFISNEKSHDVLHALRARCDAILVGIGTVLADDPLLTARGVSRERALLRVVLDRELRMPLSSQLARSITDGPVLVYCAQSVYHQQHSVVAAMNARGLEVMPLQPDLPTGVGGSGSLLLSHLLDDLGGRGVSNLLVEAGPTLAASFLQQSLADRVWIFRSPKRIEDPTALDAMTMEWPATGQISLAGDRLTEYLNPLSPVFFAMERSADFVLAAG
jgi:diaminohydroxyphosphoribosylaminopyrimidine deaminase / 5-amino-6-(5-phosphoribosylamino)uracil reductase